MNTDLSDIQLFRELGQTIKTFNKKPLTPMLVQVFRENIKVIIRQKRNKISRRNAERNFWIVLDCNSGKTLKEIAKKNRLTPISISHILWKQTYMASHPNRWPIEEYTEFQNRLKTERLLNGI